MKSKAEQKADSAKPAPSRKGRSNAESAKSARKKTRHQNRAQLRKRNGLGAALLKLIKVGLFAAAFIVIWLGVLLVHINSYKVPSPVPQTDAALVLGAALWNNVPSPGLKERLDGALTLFKQGKVKRIIVSGGLDNNGSKLTEAEGMRNYLIQKGVPANLILLENEARSTYQNIFFSSAIATKAGISSITIVTHEYHAERSADIARFVDHHSYVVYGVKTKVLSIPYNESRETLAFAKWQIDKLLMLIGLLKPGSF